MKTPPKVNPNSAVRRADDLFVVDHTLVQHGMALHCSVDAAKHRRASIWGTNPTRGWHGSRAFGSSSALLDLRSFAFRPLRSKAACDLRSASRNFLNSRGRWMIIV